MPARGQQQRAPVIDWSAQAGAPGFGGQAEANTGFGKPTWVDDFVNNAGKSDSERNPNAKIRIGAAVALMTSLLHRLR
jgi:hypothetical protein